MFLITILMILVSCSTVKTNISHSKFPYKKEIVILPFDNLTQTPYAGVKATSLTEGILRSYGVNIKRGYQIKNNKIFIKKLTSANLILKGKVIEWRYKTGIDGEPAVSLYLELRDKKGNIVWSAAGSKSQWGHKSISLTAQELLDEIFKRQEKKEKKKNNKKHKKKL